jgi:hypothetical protein
MHPSILSHRQRIDALFRKVGSMTDPADQGEWSKYLCILVSGFIEESLRILLEEYTRIHASAVIQNFVSGEVKEITNCKTSKIISILQRFNPVWESNFITEIQTRSRIPDEIKDSLDSVIANRHRIAHGKSIGLGYTAISNYYRNAKMAVETLEDVIR